MNKVVRICIGASLVLWPLFALIVSGCVVFGIAVFYAAASIVLVAWPLAMLLALWRTKGPRVRVYVACIWLAIGAVLLLWRVPISAYDYGTYRQTATKQRIESAGKALWLAWNQYAAGKGKAPESLEQLVDSIPIRAADLFPLETGVNGSDITRRNRPQDLLARCSFEYLPIPDDKGAKDRVLFRLKREVAGLGTAEVLASGDVQWQLKPKAEDTKAK